MAIKKVVIVSTGQPATNPRAVKEATALYAEGYEVNFIYSYWVDWAVPYDKQIIAANPGIHWVSAEENIQFNKIKLTASRVFHKVCRALSGTCSSNIFFARNAISRSVPALMRTAKKIKADLYIAHNLGALPVASRVAHIHGSKYAFDAEDFHRGQVREGSDEYRRTVLIEEKFIPGAAYVSSASPLIAEKYHGLFKSENLVINNVFSRSHAVKSTSYPEKPVKLFWFSQTIGRGRGIEDILLAMKRLPSGSATLTLVGSYNEEIKNYFLNMYSSEHRSEIRFQQPVPSDELFRLAASHDIGLALEQPVENNREVCLTNKIFTYLISGNAIVFTSTVAQRDFYQEHPSIGFMYDPGNIEELAAILLSALDANLLYEKKQAALRLGVSEMNWENESKKLISSVEKVLRS